MDSSKLEVVNLLCESRDSFLIGYVATFAKDWKDATVTDIDIYRKYLKDTANNREVRRAKLVNQQPTPIDDLVTQMQSAVRRYPRRYLNGLHAEF